MFLKKKEQRKLLLLKHLLEQPTALNYGALLDQLNISLPVLKRDIQSINEDFKTIKEFSTIEILSKEQTLYLRNLTPFNMPFLIKKIRLNYYLNSIHFQLFEYLFSNAKVSLASLAKELAISLPYLYKLLYLSNHFLASFDLYIDYSKKLDSILITGSKTNIRLFKTYFFWDITQGIHWLFTDLSSEEIFAYIPQEDIEYFLNLSAAKQSKYLQSIGTIHQLYPVDDYKLDLNNSFKETIMVFMNTNDFSYSLDGLLKNNFVLNDSDRLLNEQLLLNYSLRVFSSFKDSPIMQTRIGYELEQIDNELINYCKKMRQALLATFPELKQFSTTNNIEEKSLYFLTLFFANVFYIRFNPANYSDYLETHDQLILFDSDTFNQAKRFFDNFITTNPLTTTSEKSFLDSQKQIAYLLIYNIISHYKRSPIFICLYFSKNLFEEDFIRSELIKLLGKENVTIVENISEANIIISDFYEQPYQSNNYFYFDDITNKENWRKLYTFIHDYQISH